MFCSLAINKDDLRANQRASLGLGFKAFQMLEVQAAVCIDLSPNPKIGIFAKVVASLPKGSSMDDSFLYLDVGMSALFDPGTGIISI